MLPQVVRACIVANYKDLFDELVSQVTPDKALLAEAATSGNLQYKEMLENRVQNLGITPKLASWEGWKMYTRNSLETSSIMIPKRTSASCMGTGFDMLYDGSQCDASQVELIACLPDEWKIPEDDEEEMKELDYVEWPRPPGGTLEANPSASR